MAVALLVAAGRGERLGSSGPKAFVALAGRPMLEWSIDALRQVAEVQRIVVALPEGMSAPAGCLGVRGGLTRSHSVRAALAAGEGDPVLVHDAARPLVAPTLIAAVLQALDDPVADAAIAAAQVTDTIKEADELGWVTRTLDRRRLWAVQTPQAFRRSVLERALSVSDDMLAAATDDAWLVERQHGRVRVVPAPSGNLKVTTVGDLRVAEAALSDER